MAKPGATVTSKGPGLDPVLERLAELAKLRATVGYQGASGAAKAGADSDLSTATLAAIHEYGTEHVRSRPFLRRGARRGEAVAQRIAADVVADVVADKAKGPTLGMERIGEAVHAAVAHELGTAGSWGGADLVDDDQSLRRGLSHAVRKGDEIIGSERR